MFTRLLWLLVGGWIDRDRSSGSGTVRSEVWPQSRQEAMVAWTRMETVLVGTIGESQDVLCLGEGRT